MAQQLLTGGWPTSPHRYAGLRLPSGPLDFLSDRAALAAHGAAVTARVEAFVEEMGLTGLVAKCAPRP
jgi:hypothetical protein